MRWKYSSIALSSVLILSGISGCSFDPSTPKKDIAKVQSADGSPIEYAVTGKGDATIVFVHCWTCDREFWQSQVDYFSNKYQVISLDLAGHGQSGSKRTNYTMAAFGQDVVAVIQQTGAKRVILVGHSMGGPVSVEAAKLLGDRVVGIVGVDVFYIPFELPETNAEITTFIAPFKKDFQKSSEQFVRSMFTAKAPPAIVDSILNTMTSADPQMGASALSQIFSWKAEIETVDLQKFSDKLRNINAAPIITILVGDRF